MTRRNEIGVVYAAGVAQGIAQVTFPATSTIFTSPDYYGLSSAAFGVGPLERFAGLGLSIIYGWTAVAALAMGALSFVVVRRGRLAGAAAGG